MKYTSLDLFFFSFFLMKVPTKMVIFGLNFHLQNFINFGLTDSISTTDDEK